MADNTLREEAQPAGRDNTYSLKRLGFADTALEHAFRWSEWEKNQFLRWVPAIAVGTWMAFSVFDYFIAREVFGILFKIRLVCAAYFLVLGFFAIRSPVHYEVSCSLMSYGGTLGLVSMVFFLDREQSLFYFTGMMITMYLVQLMFHLPLRAALVNCLVSFFLYIPIPFALSLPARTVLGHLMYMASFAAYTIGGIWFFERSLRRQFLAERELQSAKERAEAATLLKDKFVTLVSHDLKGPLSTMLGFLKLLQKDMDSGKIGEKPILESAISAGDNMVSLINDILNVSKIRSGKIIPKLVFTDACFLAVKVMSILAAQAEQKGIMLVNRLPKKNRIYADPELLGQVLQNLVSNAIKFCKSGGMVTIFMPDGEPSTLAISDTGVGISPASIGKLFKYEEKTSTTGTAGEVGTGFGLPISNDIVIAHGGSLTVESTQGKGSTFIIRLPEHQAVVMVVDDLPRHRERIKVLLATLDTVKVIEASNGHEAWEKLRPVAPDLVITDIQMPVMDGYAFMVKMRREETFRLIPVIALSAQTGLPGENAERDKAILTGADEFLSKTASDSAILDAIRKYISA